jgi:hypothetical protein
MKFSSALFALEKFKMLFFVLLVLNFVVEIALKNGSLNKDNSVLIAERIYKFIN